MPSIPGRELAQGPFCLSGRVEGRKLDLRPHDFYVPQLGWADN